MLVPASTPDRQAYVVIMTDDDSNDDDMCELADSFYDNGIEVIIVAQTTSTTFELTCLIEDEDHLIFMETFDDINDYTGDVEALVCDDSYDIWITEVMVDTTNNERWIEVYNHGTNFSLSDLQFLGLIADSISDQSQFLQGDFYIFGNTDPCNGGCSYLSTSVDTTMTEVCYI